MFRQYSLFISFISVSLFLAGCGGSDKDVKEVIAKKGSSQLSSDRWYSNAQLIRGKKVFKENCATCHGDRGQGLVSDWKEALPDGKFPAPPLNGTAHTWHHSKELLLRTVNNGGIPLGGTMPAFKEKLSEKEKDAVLAHVMSLWPDQIYETWAKRNKL